MADLSPGPCSCGKRRYLSKKEARHAARLQPEKGRMNAYRCGDYWHLGHLPAPVIAGRMARDELVKKAR